jgi:hypothetical protein
MTDPKKKKLNLDLSGYNPNQKLNLDLSGYNPVKKKDLKETPSAGVSTPKEVTSLSGGGVVKQAQSSVSSTGTTNLLKEISSIDKNLISQDEENVVRNLNKKFNKHGFTFEETGVGDAVIAKNKKGEVIEVDLDNWTTSGDEEESLKLRKFLSTTKSLESTEEASKIFSKPKKTPKEQARLMELTDRQKVLDDMFVQEFNQKDNKENYKAQAKESLDNELSETGFLNTIATGAKNIWNSVVPSAAVITNIPAINDLKIENTLEKKIKEIKSDPKNSKLTNQQIQQKAYDAAIDQKANDFRKNEVKSYLSGMDDQTKELLQADKILEQSSISEDKKEKQIKHAAILKLAEAKANEYKTAIETYGENSEQAVRLKGEISEKISDLENLEKSIYADDDKIGTVNDEIDMLGRNYGALENFSGKFTSRAGQSIGGLAKAVVDLSQLNPLTKIATESKINQFIDDSKNIENKLARPVEKVTDASSFIDYWSDLIATQAPDLITMALAGEAEAAAYGNMFLSQFGQKKREMEKEVESGEASYTPNQMLLVPALYGSAEIVSEIPTLQILKKMGRVNKSVMANDATRRELYNTMFDKIKTGGKEYVSDQSKEIAGELFTNTAQNATDKYILGKKDVGIFDNSADVIKDTALLTSTLQGAPHVFGAVTKPFSKPEYTTVLDKNSKEIANLIKKIESTDTSEDVKSILRERVADLTKSSENIVKTVIGEIDAMPDPLKDKIISIEKKQSELRSKADTIRNDKTIDIATKKNILNGLKAEFSKTEDERVGILNNDPEYTSGIEEAKTENIQENSLSLFEKFSGIETTKQKNKFTKENPTIAFVDSNIDGIVNSVEGAQFVEC